MTTSYTFLPDVALADIAFEAKGDNVDEVFEAAAEATFAVMAKIDTVDSKIEKTISLQAEDLERLLFDFLAEIVFLKDTETMVFCTVEVKIQGTEGLYTLHATLRGDFIQPEKQELVDDVKAVTLHLFEVKQTDDGYTARVVLDI
jgi:SHS2 domain-containing protein